MATTRPGRARLVIVCLMVSAKGGSGTRRSSSDSGGADFGDTLATMITYSTYRPASMSPGKKAPAYSLTTDTPATAPYTIRSTDGGIMIPRQPPAVMAPADKRTL